MSVTKSKLDPAAVQSLQKSLRGELIDPAHQDYESARRVYNAMIDKHPALIARCIDVADAITREKQLKNWNRGWKLRLIEERNPDWQDLSEAMTP